MISTTSIKLPAIYSPHKAKFGALKLSEITIFKPAIDYLYVKN
jgi:hypothetical protein